MEEVGRPTALSKQEEVIIKDHIIEGGNGDNTPHEGEAIGQLS